MRRDDSYVLVERSFSRPAIDFTCFLNILSRNLYFLRNYSVNKIHQYLRIIVLAICRHVFGIMGKMEFSFYRTLALTVVRGLSLVTHHRFVLFFL